MGANLSTILPMIHFMVVVLACILTCIAAQPYPGDEAGRKSEAFDRIYVDHAREPVEKGMKVAGIGRIASLAAHHCSETQRQRLTDSCQQSVAQRA